MKIINDNTLFDSAGRELAIRFIQRIASLLHEAPEVAFDVRSDEAFDSELLFNLCFFGIVEFEEQSGIEVNGKKYTPRVAFDPHRSTSDDHILVGNTAVHGFVDSAEIAEGIARARASLESQ